VNLSQRHGSDHEICALNPPTPPNPQAAAQNSTGHMARRERERKRERERERDREREGERDSAQILGQLFLLFCAVAAWGGGHRALAESNSSRSVAHRRHTPHGCGAVTPVHCPRRPPPHGGAGSNQMCSQTQRTVLLRQKLLVHAHPDLLLGLQLLAVRDEVVADVVVAVREVLLGTAYLMIRTADQLGGNVSESQSPPRF
jgi:hypothetical protein